MFDERYCSKCIIKKDQPGIVFDTEGVCHLCNRTQSRLSDSFREKYESEFADYLARRPQKNGNYDCILMLSGGKDSIYMLLKAIYDHQKKVLAFTFDHPYESHKAIKNIIRVRNEFDVDQITLSSHVKYRKYMGQALFKYQTYNALSRKAMIGNTNYYLHEKQPCGVCTSYMVISAYLTAWRMGIPYILYCADPDQLAWMYRYDIKKILRDNEKYLGKNFNKEIFGNTAEAVLDQKDEELPKIIFPYISMLTTYNPEAIITELRERKLYEGDIIETHCTLWGFINYYSYKNFDTFLYACERASLVRQGIISREKEIETEKNLREIFLNIAPKSTISESQKAFIKETFKNMALVSESGADYLYELVINTRNFARGLGFAIDPSA